MSCSLNLERLRTELCSNHKATLTGAKVRECRPFCLLLGRNRFVCWDIAVASFRGFSVNFLFITGQLALTKEMKGIDIKGQVDRAHGEPFGQNPPYAVLCFYSGGLVQKVGKLCRCRYDFGERAPVVIG